jgi:hypothetical protein
MPQCEASDGQYSSSLENLNVATIRAVVSAINIYNFLAAHRPLQPSARLYEPLPLLPDIFPVAVRATPSAPTLAAR